MGDIALDDLKYFASTNCSILPTKASPTQQPSSTASTSTTTTSPLSTYTWAPQDALDCNFEVDFCLWQNDTTADIFWKRSSGLNNTFYSTGPSTDHTTLTKLGYYIFLDVMNIQEK